MVELTPMLDHTKEEPLYIQLCDYIKKEIQTGRIKPGIKLPSKRKLAIHLGISGNTIETAYQQLSAEGYVETKPRRGVFVKELESDLYPYASYNLANSKVIPEDKDETYKIDFSHGKIDLDYFPYSRWRKLTVQALYSDNSKIFLNGDPKGELELREEITKYLFQSRGVKSSAEQIVIGAGAQYLIGLLCKLIGKEPIYAMEEPGFHRTRVVLNDENIKTTHIPLDKDGISINHLKESQAKVVYVTPSHQFPTGRIMPINRRTELLKWAEQNGSYIIEDDYDGEFRYKGKPIPSLQGLDRKGSVIYLGTFSKSFIPSIRLSYIVLPSTLLAKYESDFNIYKQTVSRLHQHTLSQFMQDDYWKSHLNKMRVVYRKKQKVLVSAIKQYMDDKSTIIGEDSGLHILLSVDNNMSEAELISTAKKQKVKVYPTSIYYNKSYDNQSPMVLLGFGGLTEAKIEEGIKLLSSAWLN